MTTLTLSRVQSHTWIDTLLKVVTGAVVLSLAARATLFLPFSPVPISLAPTIAVLMGIVMGPRAGAAAVGIYLLEGVCGLPVFSGGRCGPLMLIGPTGGYLIGYLFGAYMAGLLMRRFSRTRLAFVVIASHIPIYLSGVVVLAPYVGWSRVFVGGVLPFIPGCILKSITFTSLLPRSLVFRSR